MSWRILADDKYACFWCDTSDMAFGPVIYHGYIDGISDVESALREFVREQLGKDPRKFSNEDLRAEWIEWQKEQYPEDY